MLGSYRNRLGNNNHVILARRLFLAAQYPFFSFFHSRGPVVGLDYLYRRGSRQLGLLRGLTLLCRSEFLVFLRFSGSYFFSLLAGNFFLCRLQVSALVFAFTFAEGIVGKSRKLARAQITAGNFQFGIVVVTIFGGIFFLLTILLVLRNNAVINHFGIIHRIKHHGSIQTIIHPLHGGSFLVGIHAHFTRRLRTERAGTK